MAVYTLINNSCGQTCHAERAEEKREKHMSRLVIGAGDAFGAGVLAWLADRSLTAREKVLALLEPELQALLIFASAVAAMNCAQAGANPPRRSEVEQFIAQYVF